MTNTKKLTRDLTKDFICYRLRSAGYENCQLYQFSAGGNNSVSVIHKTLRNIGDEFHTSYFNSFEDMTSTINIHGDDLKDVIYQIFHVTCQTGIEWGRLVGIFVFAASLAVKSMDCERTDVVENIIQWTSAYLEDKQFCEWINQHGGWDGFVQFYKNPKLRNQDMNEHLWNRAYNVSVGVFAGVVSVANLLLR